MIDTTCPSCGCALRCPDSAANNAAKCSECGFVFIVRHAAAPLDESDADASLRAASSLGSLLALCGWLSILGGCAGLVAAFMVFRAGDGRDALAASIPIGLYGLMALLAGMALASVKPWIVSVTEMLVAIVRATRRG